MDIDRDELPSVFALFAVLRAQVPPEKAHHVDDRTVLAVAAASYCRLRDLLAEGLDHVDLQNGQRITARLVGGTLKVVLAPLRHD